MNCSDKIGHFAAGFMIATVFQFSILAMVISVTIAGVGKELYDKYIKKTYFDWKDLVCTEIGGYLAIWIMIVYK